MKPVKPPKSTVLHIVEHMVNIRAPGNVASEVKANVSHQIQGEVDIVHNFIVKVIRP